MSTEPLGHPYTGDPPGVDPRPIWIKTVLGEAYMIDFNARASDFPDLSDTQPALWNVPEEHRSSVLEVQRMDILRATMQRGDTTWKVMGLDGVVSSRHIVKAWFGPSYGSGSVVLTPALPNEVR